MFRGERVPCRGVDVCFRLQQTGGRTSCGKGVLARRCLQQGRSRFLLDTKSKGGLNSRSIHSNFVQ